MVSLAVIGGIMAATLALALSARAAYRQDQNRTLVNQNLRAGLDLIGLDVRQAGQRLPGDVPAIQIVDGASGAADRLILRRNLVDQVLPVCRDVHAGSAADAIFVAKAHGLPPPGCAPVADANSDGWPDNLEAWREYRLGRGGAVPAYIFNPVTGNGEFFTYDAEDQSTFHVHRGSSGNWQFGYDVDQGSRIYLLEQREFRLSGELLQCVIDGDTPGALNLVTAIRDLQVRAFFSDGTVLSAVPWSTDWRALESLEVELSGRVDFGPRTIDRTVVSRFFPRSILSD